MKTAVRQFRDKAISLLTAFALLISAFSAFSLNFRASAEDAEEFVDMEIAEYRLWYMDPDIGEFVDVSKTEDTLYVKDGDGVKFYLKWFIPNNIDNYNLQTVINSHGIKFDIPADGKLYYEGEEIGTYEVITEEPSNITYFRAYLDKDKVKDKSNISGGLIIDGVIELDKDGTVKNGSNQTLEYGDKSVDVIYYDGKSNGSVTISKSGGSLSDDGSGNYTINYTVNVTINGMIDKATVTDVLPEGLTIKEDTLTVSDSAGNPVPFTAPSDDTSIGSIVLSQVAGANKDTITKYTIKYSAEITREDLIEKFMKKGISIENIANVDYIDADGEPQTVSASTSTSTNGPNVSKTASTSSSGSFVDNIDVTCYENGHTVTKNCRVIEYAIQFSGSSIVSIDSNDVKEAIKTLKDYFSNLNKTQWLPYCSYTTPYEVNGKYYNYTLNQAPTYLSELIYKYCEDPEGLSKMTEDEYKSLIDDYYSFDPSTNSWRYKIIIIDDNINKNGIGNGKKSLVNNVEAKIKDIPVTGQSVISDLPGIDVLDKTLEISADLLKSPNVNPNNSYNDSLNWAIKYYQLNSSDILSGIFPDIDGDPSTLDIPWKITIKGDELKKVYSSGSKVILSDILGFVFPVQNGYDYDNQPLLDNVERIPGTPEYSEPATHYFDTESTDESNHELEFWNTFTIDYGGITGRPGWSLNNKTLTGNKWTVELSANSGIIESRSDITVRYYSKIKLIDNKDGTYSIPDMFIEAMRNIYNTSSLQVNSEPPYNDNFTLQYKAPAKETDKPKLSDFSKNSIASVSFGGEKKTLADDMSIGWWFGIPVDNISSSRDGKADVMTFEDKLPEGLKFNKDSLIAVYWDGSGYSSSTSNLSTSKTLEECKLDSSCYTVAYDETERKLTITFTATADFETKVKELSAKRIAFFFSSDIEKDFISEHSDETSHSFKNSATVTYDGEDPVTKSSSVTKNFPQLAKKSGVIVDEQFDPENYVMDMRMKARYTLEINPLALDLIKDLNTLTIKDVMNEHLILLPETVQFIDGNTGDALSGAGYSFSYDPADNNTVVFNIPDEAYVKIVYDTVIDVDPGENPNWLKETNNKFTIDGLDRDNASAEVETASFNGRVQAYVRNETGSITISKYFVDDDGEHNLAGAGFMLYSVYDNFGKVAEEPMLTDPVKIPDSGSVVINELPLDRIYWLKEVSAPEGFLVDEIGTYFMLTGDSGVKDPRGVANPNADTKALAEKITAALGSNPISEYEGTVASNVHKFLNIKEVTISGTKTWVGDSGYNVRPDEITLLLFANGKPYEGTYETEWIKNGDEWTFTISGLPERDKEGNVITYTLKEVKVPFYESEITVDSDGNINITNTFTAEKVNVHGTKIWVNDNENVRPDDITLVLKADGLEVKGAVPTWTKSGNNWTYEFKDLDKYIYTKEDGVVSRKAIKYTVTENNVPLGYTVTVDNVSDTETNITNTFTAEKVNVHGTKIWVNDNENVRPDDITLVLKADGVVVEDAVPTWTKSDDKWTYEFKDLDKYTYTKEDGVVSRKVIEYIVTEIIPDGYTAEYERSEDAEGNTIVDITNTATVTKITKVDEADNPLSGAELVVTDKNGKPVDTWTTATGAHIITGLIAGETYYLSEKTAPDGYNTAETIEFTVKSDGTVLEIEMTDTVTVTEISKTDKDENFVPNAHLILKDENGDTVADWFTGNEVKVIEKLIVGKTYTLMELSAPDGYTVAKEIQFTVKDGVTTEVVMTDALTETHITKVDENGKPLAGAHLIVTDENGTKVDEWESKTEAHQITGLVAGETYTITETVAPAGYAISESQTFTVEIDKITVVTFANALTVTEIAKVDENNKPIAGAHLIVTDENGDTVAEWDSTKSTYTIQGLVAGETYTITETAAPSGYETAKPVKFTVNADGSLTEVTMKNYLTVTKITKTDENGNALAGAHLILKNKNGVIVERWISTDGSYRITGLTAGEKYTLIELDAPEGYERALPITFEVKGNGEVTVVAMEDSLKTDSSPETGVSGSAAVLAVLSGAAIVILSKKKKR